MTYEDYDHQLPDVDDVLSGKETPSPRQSASQSSPGQPAQAVQQAAQLTQQLQALQQQLQQQLEQAQQQNKRLVEMEQDNAALRGQITQLTALPKMYIAWLVE